MVKDNLLFNAHSHLIYITETLDGIDKTKMLPTESLVAMCQRFPFNKLYRDILNARLAQEKAQAKKEQAKQKREAKRKSESVTSTNDPRKRSKKAGEATTSVETNTESEQSAPGPSQLAGVSSEQVSSSNVAVISVVSEHKLVEASEQEPMQCESSVTVQQTEIIGKMMEEMNRQDAEKYSPDYMLLMKQVLIWGSQQ